MRGVFHMQRVELAKKVFGKLKGKQTIIIGAGK